MVDERQAQVFAIEGRGGGAIGRVFGAQSLGQEAAGVHENADRLRFELGEGGFTEHIAGEVERLRANVQRELVDDMAGAALAGLGVAELAFQEGEEEVPVQPKVVPGRRARRRCRSGQVPAVLG